MNTKFLSIMLITVLTVNYAQAQKYFAGGRLGVDYKDSKYTYDKSTTNRPSTSSFDLSPMLGYYLTDNLGAGVKISLGMSLRNDRAEEDPTKNTSTDWGFGPFLRYTALSRGDFSILIEGGLGVSGSSSKTTYGTTTNDGPKQFGFDIGVMPILSFSLTDRVSIEASTNVARFGFSTNTETRGTGESQSKDTETSFGFGVDSYDFFKSPYQLGIIFKF